MYPDLFQDTPLEITTWVDSTSALRRLRFLQHEKSLTRAYPADADLQSHIKWLWSQTPHLIPKLAWVKAHQDDRILYTKLSQPAKLNVLADQLATDYLTKSKVRPRSNPLFFPSSTVSLLVNGQRVTPKYSANIRFHIQGTIHRTFLQKSRPEWSSDKVWNSIDMEGFGLAFRMLDVQTRLTISKMAHGWQNTGHQRIKIHPEASSCCPSCLAQDETGTYSMLFSK